MTDEEKIAEIRSRMYEYVSSNPTGEHAEKARQILSALPAQRPSDMPLPGMHGSRDDQDATTLQAPQGRTLPSWGHGSQPLADVRAGSEKPLIHEDPIGTALVSGAMGGPGLLMRRGMSGTLPELAAEGAMGSGTMSALNSNSPRDVATAAGAGAALPLLLQIGSALGGKLAGSEGGRAAQVLADRGLPIKPAFDEAPGGFKPAATVKGGDFGGMPAGKAVERLEALKASPNLPRGTSDAIDAEIARIRTAASTPDPEVEAARKALELHGPHMGDLGLGGGAAAALMHTGHAGLAGIPGIAMMLARNATPLAGRAVAPIASAVAGATPAVPAAAYFASPIMQAVMGGQASPPTGGTP